MSAPGSAAARVAVSLVNLINLYRQAVSPMRLPTCRFSPTCSQYAVDALTEYGLVNGSRLALVRLLKCGPWHRGGWDPIPERPGAAQHHHQGVEAADELWDSPAHQGKCDTRV
jgi:uncharacterized protein